MNVLSQLWSAVRSLADNVTALADTVGQVNLSMRQRLGMDGSEGPTSPEEVDHTANGQLPRLPPPEPPAPPRGRRKQQADAAADPS